MLRFVALDMDGTLVDVASSWGAVHEHFGDRNDEGLRRFLANEIDDEEFIRSDVRLWWKHRPDLTIDEIEAILKDVPLMPGAEALIRGLKKKGATTAIVSGGLDILAHRIARELGIDIALANGLRVDASGRLTGEGIVRVPIHRKEEAMERLQTQLGFSKEESAAVGNSDIDVGLFRRSKVGVAFLPVDDTVRAAATSIVEEKDLCEVYAVLLANGLPKGTGPPAAPPLD
ncbi:MAG TPA: HAD-IB family phosphatase [Thermoplasmata archaeon]|nr:HAD-IB family phosphatase [Thermoplasmata archaeon]